MAFAASASVARAQQPSTAPLRTVVSKTAGALCDQNHGLLNSHSELVRSPVLASPGGVFLAYSENVALAFNRLANGEPPDYECANTASIFLAGPKNHRFVPVIVQNATTDSPLNYLGLIDWSPDGRYLLCELFIAAYGTDSSDQYVLLYDAYYGVLSPRELVYQALDRLFGKKCGVRLNPLGFSKDGRIVLDIGPYYDVEGSLDPDSCPVKNSVWLLNASEVTLTRAPANFKLVKFGRWLSAPGIGKHANSGNSH